MKICPKSVPSLSQVDEAERAYIKETMNLLKTEMSLADLMASLGEKNRTRFKKKILDILIVEKLVTPTVPNKPNSSKQKYVLTPQGMEIIMGNNES